MFRSARRAELREHRRRTIASPAPEVVESARAAGLRYVNANAPGFGRRRKGKRNFTYFDADGRAVTDAVVVARIGSLAIPPAWQNVWICPFENGHLQATGKDARGRKQYRYHPRFRQVRDRNKYEHIIEFAQALPAIRRRVEADLSRPGLPREKVLAAVVRLLETTFIRVGNAEYKKQNESYGLTTMLDRHARICGAKIQFRFRGKSGVEHAIDLEDPRLARIVKACQNLPGEELFAYQDEDGRAHDIGSGDVNDYLRDITGQEFTAKDFRTWAGTVLAARALQEFESVDSKARMKKNIVQAIESVAKRLGNTRAVCKKCYIHPAVIESYLDGSMLETLGQRAKKLDKSLARLRPEEAAVLVLLQTRLAREAKPPGRSPRKRRAA